MIDTIKIYRDLCLKEKTIPLFSQAWWLDATAGDGNWNVALVMTGTEVQAAMPYVVNKRYGFTLLGQPALTQTLGPWLREINAKYAKKLSSQKDLMNGLIKILPEFHHYSQKWPHQQTNWLPFFWANFKQTTRYTYVLPDLSNEELIWNGIQQNIRTDIRKARDKFGIKIREDLGIDEFLKLNKLVFDRQGIDPPYSEAFVKSIDAACTAKNSRRIFIAEDLQGRQHAGIYLIWDENSAYYLMGGGDPDLRNSGATSLCMWEAIKFSTTVTKRFDFEGSMIEPVERFFRAFGAIQTPYFSVTKTRSRLLKTVFFLRDLKSGT